MEISSKLQRIFITVAILAISRNNRASSALTTCGGTLRGRTGTFTSPNYPHAPKRDPEAVGSFASDGGSDIVTCEWKIIVSSGRGIQFNFGDFDMAAGLDECAKGELEVFLGINKKKRSLDKYCGGDELNTLQLSSNEVTVIFRRPAKFSGKGFLVSYIEITPGVTIYDFVTCVDRGTNHVGVGSYSVLCPGGCASITDMFIRGKSAYRDDSYLCKAAVHAGVISDMFGGRIDVKKLPGKTLYMGSEANGVTSEAGAMSDTMFKFVRPDEHCDDKIELQMSQLTASSYWTEDVKDKDKTKWKPDKAILGKGVYSWSPNNLTTEQWLQVDLRKTKTITAITTRGSPEEYYRTQSYRIAYRNDTRSPWQYYREDGVSEDKIFVGNQHIFKETRNNFIHPRISGRFIRIYPTPVASENTRYSLQIALSGCDIPGEDLIEPPLIPPEEPSANARTSTTPVKTVSSATTRASELRPEEKGNATKYGTTRHPHMGGVDSTANDNPTKVPVQEAPLSPADDKRMNENSIIVIAIVAALAVTSILLAALVLILVRKRKKEPKDGPTTPHPLQTAPDNNNTRFYYKSKKSRKRSRKNGGEYFQNADYKDTLLQVSFPQNATSASQSATLPADQVHFAVRTSSQNGTIPFNQNGVMSQHSTFRPPNETDSFVTEDDDDDHEYQVIDDDHVVGAGTTPVPSVGRGSSKASTGSSMGNHSRKSDTMQRSWGVDGNQWKNQPPFPPNSPIFTMQDYPMNGHSIKPPMPGFLPKTPHSGGFSYPKGSQLSRNHTFSQETRYSAGEAPSHPPNLRRGNSQSPSRMQRHSSSSNNSSHSHPSNGASPYSHDLTGPYYSSVPNGSNNSNALNHVMYSGPTIPEQIEIPTGATKRALSVNAPRPQGGDVSALPGEIGNGVPNMERGSEPSIGFHRNASLQMRADYDRLYRNNSAGGSTENKNIFSVANGSHSQYDQLNLNGANV